MPDFQPPPNYGLDCPISGDASGFQVNPQKMAKQIRKAIMNHSKRKLPMSTRRAPRHRSTKWY